MAKVSMQQVKELRDRTQAGLNDCKTALQDADGDMERAVELILKKGLAKSAKRAGAIAAEGEVATKLADGTSGVIAEVNIQTDFAARNDDFKKFVQDVLEVASNDSADDGEDLSGKDYPGGGTLEENRQRLVAKLGENVNVRRWAKVRLEGPGRIQDYVHMGGKMAGIVALRTTEEAAKKPELAKLAEELAMHVVASAPICIDSSAVPDEAKKKQADIYSAQLAEEGKVPEDRRPKVVEGKIGKWMKEVCLLDQPWVLEPKKNVAAVLSEASKALGADLTVARFVRFERGEGIEQATDDFAAEATKMSQGD